MPRHFLRIADVSPAELRRLLKDARALKRLTSVKPLTGKTIALVFQKPSMRTRVAFEVAVHQLGGAALYLDQNDIKLGEREPIKDVARALSRYVEAIVVRVFAHCDAEEFAQYAGVPVINGLSDLHHPCQALADLLTVQEACGRLRGAQLAYVGDGNNVLHSLLEGAAMIGLSVRVATPPVFRPDRTIWSLASRLAKRSGATVQWTGDPTEAVRGADVVYTDVWVSMGQERERAKRVRAFRPYQVNGRLLSKAKPECRVMHCLPAHRGEEISDDVMEGTRSLVFEQAENRLHVQKALLAFLLRP